MASEDASVSDNDIMAHGAHTYIFCPADEKIKDGDKGKKGRSKKQKKDGPKRAGPNPKGSAGSGKR